MGAKGVGAESPASGAGAWASEEADSESAASAANNILDFMNNLSPPADPPERLDQASRHGNFACPPARRCYRRRLAVARRAWRNW